MTNASAEQSLSNKPVFVINTLGRFDVIKGDRSLVRASSGSKKIWELYKFMLTHRGRSFTPETLMDQLWISEEYNDPRSTLRQQMHRLRQALLEDDCRDEEKTLSFTSGYYRWNENASLQLDTQFFEDLIRQGDALKDTSAELALEAYETALSLYHGDYLPDCVDQHWVFPIRNHLRRQFLRTVLNVIELLKYTRAGDGILPLCQRAIQIDIYEEAFHLNLMEALLNKGDQKQALEHYEYITAFYYREMGLKPSDEMRGLYKRMLKGQHTIQSEESLYDALESDEPLENAFFCEPEVFKSIYELERRRCQRTGVNFSIGVLTVTPQKGYTYSQEELRKKHLKQQLLERLRIGDTFTKWNEYQFVVLLPGVDAALTQNVLNRVLDQDESNPTIAVKQIMNLFLDFQHHRLI